MPSSVEPLTAAELEDLTRNLLSDNINMVDVAPDSLSPQTWSTQQVYDALNFAIKEYCKSTNASYMESNSNLDSNGVASIPSSYIKVENVFYPSTALNSKPLYIRTNNPSAAFDSDKIYTIKGNSVYLWNPRTSIETTFAVLPDYEGAIYDLQISHGMLHLLTQKKIYAAQYGGEFLYHGESIQTMRYSIPLDGSSLWSLNDRWGWVEWWGPGFNDLYRAIALTASTGKTFYIGDFRWHEDQTERGSINFLSGQSSSNNTNWKAINGVYYSNSDRTLFGVGFYYPIAISQAIDVTRQPSASISVSKINSNRPWLHILGSKRWVYWSDTSGVHAGLLELGSVAGSKTWIIVNETIYPGVSMSNVPAVPFGDKSLIILADGGGLWWDGVSFAPDDLSTMNSRFDIIRSDNSELISTSGRAVSLSDGSVLHVG